MSIKLGKYSLPDKTINQMKTALLKSIQTGKELGFTLCANQKDNLLARNMCTGGDCHIVVTTECSKHETYAGMYHTHPFGDSNASASDLNECGASHSICVGGREDNKIRCYVWQHEHLTEKKYKELKKLCNKGITQIDGHTYEKNFQCMKDLIQPASTYEIILEKDKIILKQWKKLQAAKRKGAPKHIIDKMEKDMKHDKEYTDKLSSDMNKKLSELVSKYYKVKVL